VSKPYTHNNIIGKNYTNVRYLINSIILASKKPYLMDFSDDIIIYEYKHTKDRVREFAEIFESMKFGINPLTNERWGHYPEELAW